MTISVPQSLVVLEGNGATTVFSFGIISGGAQNIEVIHTPSGGTPTILSTSSYSITIPPIAPGSLWATGGFVTYPLSGSPIPSGDTLTIQRILPLEQLTDISSQGNFYPDVVEQALDTLEMQIQQISVRTGQFRGVWQTDVVYNYGDIAQDGANGDDSGNYYMCIIANTSGVWNTDLASGDWQLIIISSFPTTPLPLSISNGGTGQITSMAALTALGGVGISSTNAFTGANSFTGGSITVPTRNAGDNSTNAASTAFVTSGFVPIVSPNFQTSALLNGNALFDKVNVQKFATSGTYTPSTGMVYCIIEAVGGGGGGAGAVGNAGSGGGAGGGGAGAYSKKTVSASSIGSSQTVTIGAAGSGAAAGNNNGGNGGATSLGSICIANGGTGGSGTIGGQEPGGQGGVSGTGDIAGTGSPGTWPSVFSSATAVGGYGGNSVWGGGGMGGPSNNSVAAGSAGTGYGAGGGGAGFGSSSSSAGGGAGTAGYLIVTEFISA